MSSQPHASAPRRRVGRGFVAGLRYPWRGARFVYIEHPSLARLWIPPIVVTFCLLVACGWLAIDLHERLAEALWTTPSGSGWFAGVLRFLHGALEVMVAIVLFAAGVAMVALGSSVIAAPFNDALSEAVESLYLERGMPRFSVARALRDVVRTVGLELLKLLIYASVMLPLFGFSLLVPIAPLQAAVGFCFTALFFAIDYVDFAASRREFSAGQRMRWAFAHLGAMLGLGTSIWLLLLTPLLNLLFMPAAVAGGTLLFLDLAGPRVGQTEQDETAGRRTSIPL